MNTNEFLRWEQASQDTIDFKKIYVDVAEDLVAGLLLSQIVYWNLPNKEGKTKLRVKIDGELWLAKGREDWFEEIRISPKQFDRASKILLEKGIIEKKIKKFDGLATIHIKLNFDVLLKLIDSVLNHTPKNDGMEEMAVSEDSVGIDQRVKGEFTKGEKGNLPKVKRGIDQRVKPITENTTKTTNKDYNNQSILENNDNNSISSTQEDEGLIDSKTEEGRISLIAEQHGFSISKKEASSLLYLADEKDVIANIIKAKATGNYIANPFQYILTMITNKNNQTPIRAVTSTEEVNPKSFNNFQGREYDYDSLEKKLLGWE